MKRIKITLPKGGTREVSKMIGETRHSSKVNVSPASYEFEAEEIIIEGDVPFSGKVNASQPERIPFDLEAAKAGAPVLWGTAPARWVGTTDANKISGARNIIETAHGLAYATDADLFMAPKPKRTVWVNIYEHSIKHSSEAEAVALALKNRIATVPVEIDA